MSRPAPRAALLAACVLLLPLTAASCDDEDPGVRLGAATVGTVDEIVEAPGSVTARTAATLTAPAAGTLAELLVSPGDRVTKGQILAVVDAPELHRRRTAAERALDRSPAGGGLSSGTAGFSAVRERTDRQAATAFTEARSAAGNIADPNLKQALLHQIDAAQQQYSTASATAAAAVRSVQRGVASLSRAVNALSAAQRLQAEQAYELADAAVDALTLRAPVAGVVQLGGPAPAAGGGGGLSALLESGGVPPLPAAAGGGSGLAGVDDAIPQGAYVSAGTPILTVVDTSSLGLVAEVDETDVLLVQPGATGTAELDAATGAGYPVTVRAVDLLPTTSARGGVSYRIRLDLRKGAFPDGARAPDPRPGMSAVLRLSVRQASEAVTVPASAVVSADGRDTVWTVRDGRYERVPVTLGVQGEDVVQIVSGIGDGAQVVVSGTDQVQPGQQVR